MSGGLKVKSVAGDRACMPAVYEQSNNTMEEPETRALLLFATQSLARMTEREKNRLFPADGLGISLPIYIPGKYRAKDGKLNADRYPINRHHRFAPEKFLKHKQGELGKILRYSCLQLVPVELHNKFNRKYDKPLLPDSRLAKFGAILLSVARYLPAEAIEFGSDGPTRRELTPRERHLIWANNELRPEQGVQIQRAILEYVAKQNINGASEGLVEEFITTSDEKIRVQNGRELFRMATEVAMEPIGQKYVEAWESKLLPRHDIRSERGALDNIVQARAVPKSPEKFITRHLAKDKYVLHYALRTLHENLERTYLGQPLQTEVNTLELAA